MKGLDILTPKGQKTLADEMKCKSLFEATNPGRLYIATPKDMPADVDAVILRGASIEAVVEQKSRYNCRLTTFMETWDGEWLITSSKLDRGYRASMALQVPFYGFLYIVDDDLLLTKKFSGPDGVWVAKIRREETVTQATVNGGSAFRLNAFVDMTDAKIHRRPEPAKPKAATIHDSTRDWVTEYEAEEKRQWGAHKQ